MLPEKIFAKIKNSILPQWRVCFLTALVVGFVAHIYKITNWLPNWDSLVFRYDAQNMLRLGRWFLPVACGFTSFYELPFLNGLFAIVFHGLGAVCICHLLSVKKNITAGLIGGLAVSFPTVISVMMYSYVADGYSIAFFLSCLGALYLTKDGWKHYALGVVLIALAVGIYQAYITVTVMLILLWLIEQTVYEQKNVKELLQKTGAIFLSGALAMGLYYGILTLLLSITGTSLLEYQGLSSSASLSGIDLLASFYAVKEAFFSFFFDFSKGFTVFNMLNIAVFILTAYGYLKTVIQQKLSPGKAVLLGVYVLLLPVGSVVLAFINSTVEYHNLMKMGYIIFYLFLPALYERQKEEKKAGVVTAWMLFVVCGAVICNQIVLANVSYHKSQMAYEKSYGMLIRLADRIEQTKGSSDCKELLVIGALPESEAYGVLLPPDITGVTEGYILRADDETVGQSVLCSALNDYCGKEYRFLAGEEKQKFMEKETICQMPCWPAEDSIAIEDDVLVIKLGVESE